MPAAWALALALAAAPRDLDENLLQASRLSQTAAVRSLVAAGRAGVNVRDVLGWTPLMYAAAHGDAELVVWLLEHDADSSLENSMGETALVLAAKTGDAETVGALLDRGVDPGATDAHGRSAWDWAVGRGHEEIAARLVAAGAVRHERPPVVPAHLAADGLEPPQVRHLEQPEYPESAKQREVSGEVVLEIVITERGEVIPARVVRSPGLAFEENSVAAAERWRFEPAKRNGEPVPAVAEIVVNFQFRK